MTTAVYPDREHRVGGRWSTPTLTEDILRLASLERAIVHVASGWVPRIGELDDKIRLASALDKSMARAISLRSCALTLFERDESALTASASWTAPIKEIDASSDAKYFADTFVVDTTHFMLQAYGELASKLDPLYDAKLVQIVDVAIADLSRSTPMVDTPLVLDGQPGQLFEDLLAAWDSPTGERVHLDFLLWGPQHRVRVPARPTGRYRKETGSLGHLREGSRRELRNIAGELNENLTAELCALELMCRSSYEHPDLPWSEHMTIFRHATDETRHAAIFRRLLKEHGCDERDLPQHGTNYEFAYEFPECEEGSKREVVWRLLLLCTVLEGLAIDKIPPEIATLDWLDQTDIARALDYISADELYHAENGLRITRRLCADNGLDPMIERERVHGRFFARQLEVRSKYLEADPERAEREIALLSGPDPDGVPFSSRTEIALRKRASFTDAECEQVNRWGYNPRTESV